MIKIIGIDPASTHIGVAIFYLDPITLKIYDIETIHLNVTRPVIENTYNEGILYRLKELREEIGNILEIYKPFLVSIESPYINRMTSPSAVIPLARALETIKESIIDYDPNLTIIGVTPSEGKNAIGAKGGAKKDGVLEAMKKHSVINKLFTGMDTVTDHEIDAIAIGYYGYLKLIENPHLILKIKR